MELLMLQLSTLLYGLAAAGYVAALLRPALRVAQTAAFTLSAAFVLHTFFIIARGLSDGILPVLTFTEGLAFFGWLLVGLFLIAQARYRLHALGAVVAPLAFVSALAAALFASGGATLPENIRSPWLAVHITLAFLGNAVFALAFASSSLYLLQESQVKNRRRGGLIQRLPPLGQLDRLSYLFLAWGFPLLTLGILSGGVWAAASWGRFWTGEPREVLSALTWLLYAGLIQLRLTGGLGGRRAARFTVFAFGVLVISYIAVNVLGLPGRHGAGASL